MLGIILFECVYLFIYHKIYDIDMYILRWLKEYIYIYIYKGTC